MSRTLLFISVDAHIIFFIVIVVSVDSHLQTYSHILGLVTVRTNHGSVCTIVRGVTVWYKKSHIVRLAFFIYFQHQLTTKLKIICCYKSKNK